MVYCFGLTSKPLPLNTVKIAHYSVLQIELLSNKKVIFLILKNNNCFFFCILCLSFSYLFVYFFNFVFASGTAIEQLKSEASTGLVCCFDHR